MKRLFTLIVAISSIVAAMAQFPMATLSRNGALTQFTGVLALQSAIEIAEPGDIIYLSEGEFLSSNTEIWIDPRIRIVGCGYNSYISLHLQIYAGEEYSWDGKNLPVLDGVRIKHLDHHPDSYCGEYLVIRNSWIESYGNASHGGKEVHIDKCFIDELRLDGGNATVYLNNCKIRYAGSNFVNAIVTNCSIKSPDLPRVLISSILESSNENLGFYTSGTHKAYNSLFLSDVILNYENASFQDCYFDNSANGLLDENLYSLNDLAPKGYLGQDGTIIGAYGGENPFSVYPSVPTIDSEKSSVEYDAASKKLNVTITVAND